MNLLTTSQYAWIGRLTSEVTAQQNANRIKKRKLRALRREVRRLRNALAAARQKIGE